MAFFRYNIEAVKFEGTRMRLMLTLLAVIYSAAFSHPQRPPPYHHSPPPPLWPQAQPPTLTWQQFKTRFGKHYASLAEEHYRSQVFARAVRKMRAHNANPMRKYDMRINPLFDVENDEFHEVYTKTYASPHRQSSGFIEGRSKNRERVFMGQRKDREIIRRTKNQSIKAPRKTIPQKQQQKTTNQTVSISLPKPSPRLLVQTQQIEIDWSLISGKVRFQGTCGACYAFTAVQTFAATYSKSFGFFLPLSIQQVIDCADNGLAFGCRGGFLEGAFTQLQTNGVVLQAEYPYTSESLRRSGKCKKRGGPFKLGSFQPIPQGNCKAVLNQLKNGPISVGIAGYGLQYYGSGVFDDCNNNLDHAVMIVGYRSGVGWRIKNSWGKEWGEDGYGWIAQGNTCGICDMAFSIQL